MLVQHLHAWDVDLEDGRRWQENWCAQLVFRPLPHFEVVAAAGVSFSLDDAYLYAAVVVMRLPDFRLVEVARAERRSEFPYVPGYLSFRKAPVLLDAFEKLQTTFI